MWIKQTKIIIWYWLFHPLKMEQKQTRWRTNYCSCCSRNLSVLCCSLSSLYFQEVELKHRRKYGKRLTMAENRWQNPLLSEWTDFHLRSDGNWDEKLLRKKGVDRQRNWINELRMGTEWVDLNTCVQRERLRWDDLRWPGCCWKNCLLHAGHLFLIPSSNLLMLSCSPLYACASSCTATCWAASGSCSSWK